jgi:hypothetical protein
MRHGTPDGDDTEVLHPLATDEPGLILRRPVAKWRQIAIIYALLPLLCAALGGFVAVKVADASTDRRLATLEQDLAERRKVRAEQDAARDARTRDLLALVCVLLDHAQPRDADVEARRRQFGCDGGPYPQPSPIPTPVVPAPGTPRTSAWRPSRPVPRSAGATQRRPTPSPGRPAPAPSPSAGGGIRLVVCVDLPLLPPICL